MQAPKIETQTLPPPPGIIGSLRAGFDVTAGHITAILMPVVLDVFLWLGPRVSVYGLAQPVLKYFGDGIAANGGLKPDDVASMMALYQKAFQEFNLFALLRTFPIGISSILSGKLPGLSPLGAASTLQVDTYLNMLVLIVGLNLIGWMFGGLYFRWVADLVTPENPTPALRAILQTLIYSLIWLAVCWILGIPIFFTLALIFMFNAVAGEIALVILAFISMWLIVPVFFSPHGIFVRKQNAFASIVSSFQLARFTLPTSSLFVMSIFLVSFASNFLWSIPTNDSWLTLVGIFGHAFVTTALLASTFIYYQDMTGWLQTVLMRIRGSQPANPA